MCEETVDNKVKQGNAIDMDPAYIASFEASMLDYDMLTVKVEGEGLRLKYDKCYRRLQREGHWDTQWIMASYTLVCCKMSPLPRALRDFVEYIGDNAASLWMDAQAEAQRRVSEPSKEG